MVNAILQAEFDAAGPPQGKRHVSENIEVAPTHVLLFWNLCSSTFVSCSLLTRSVILPLAAITAYKDVFPLNSVSGLVTKIWCRIPCDQSELSITRIPPTASPKVRPGRDP
jgi:hypothetical protein